MNLASDNFSPVAPEVLEAISRSNTGYQPAYGAESLFDSVRDQVRELFEAPNAQPFLVSTGTAANALCLSCLCPPYGIVYCHAGAHVDEDECGAPEFYTGGAKLKPLIGKHGRVDAPTLKNTLESAAPAGVHNVQNGALSISNATELGAVYDCETVSEISTICGRHGIPVYLDGARFANAAAHLNCTPAEMTWKAGISALVLGGTKNGLLGAETVILFDEELCWEFELRRKRGGHLLSKHRYLAAQINAYLTDGLWLRLAEKANTSAQYLCEQLNAVPDAEIAHPVEANMVFPMMPRCLHQKLMSRGAEYFLWPHDADLNGVDDELVKARLVCDWTTTKTDIDRFVEICVEK